MSARINRRRFTASLPAGLAALGAGSAMAGPTSRQHPAFLAQDASPASEETVEEFIAPAPDKYDPEIDITTVGIAWPTIVYPPGDDLNNNTWTRGYKSKYGINTNTLWAVPPDQYPERVNLMLASGDLPDFFQVNPTQFAQLVGEGRVMDVTDLYNSASDSIKNAVTEGGPIPLDSATFDGRIMSIPHSTVAKEGASVLWVRTDWLDAVGLEAPSTMEELLAVADAFVTQNVNGNGNTIGLALDKDLNYAAGFFEGYGAYREIWVDDGEGGLAYGSIQPEMKEALGALQQLYANNQIDLEFGTKGQDKIVEDLAAGRIGMYYGSGYDGPWPLQNVKANFPDSDWVPLPIVSATDDPARPMASLGIAGYWVLRDDAEHPEALLKLLQFWMDAFYDTKSTAVNVEFSMGTGQYTGPWRMNVAQIVKPYKNLNLSKNITELIESGNSDTSGLTPEERDVYARITGYLDNGEVDGWGWTRIYGPDGAMVKVVDQYVKDDNFVQSGFYGAPTPSMVSRMSTLETQELEMFTRIIQGESLDLFDEFVATWKALGGDDITQEVNDWAASR